MKFLTICEQLAARHCCSSCQRNICQEHNAQNNGVRSAFGGGFSFGAPSFWYVCCPIIRGVLYPLDIFDVHLGGTKYREIR